MKAFLIIGVAMLPSVLCAAPSHQRQQEMVHVVVQDCGSCHGLTLKGGLGPSLLPDALADKPKDLLFATIKFGREGTAMPPWQPFFTDDEIHWMVEQLLKGDLHEVR